MLASCSAPGVASRPGGLLGVGVEFSPDGSVAAARGCRPDRWVAAQSGGDERQQLQQQIGDASAEESAALAGLQTIRDRKAAIDAQVAALDQQVAVAEAKLGPLQTEADRLAAEAAALQVRLTKAEQRLTAAQHELDVTAAQLYRSARHGSSYESIYAMPPHEVVRSTQYGDRVGAKRQQVLTRVVELRDQIDAQHRAVASKQAQADQAAAQARTERDTVASLRAQIEPAQFEAAQQQSAEEQALAEMDGFEAELASLRAASDAVAAALRARGGPVSNGHPCDSRPVPGAGARRPVHT